MSAPAKFTFDTVFDADGRVVSSPPPRPKTRFSQDEVNAAFAEGEAAGRKAEEAEAARRMAAACETIRDQIGGILGALGRTRATLEADCASLALETARILAKGLVEKDPTGDIEALIRDCLDGLSGEPHVVVRVSPALHEGVAARLGEIVAGTEFQGQVAIEATADLDGSACRLVWKDGGAEFSMEARLQEIGRLVTEYVTVAGQGQFDLFGPGA